MTFTSLSCSRLFSSLLLCHNCRPQRTSALSRAQPRKVRRCCKAPVRMLPYLNVQSAGPVPPLLRRGMGGEPRRGVWLAYSLSVADVLGLAIVPKLLRRREWYRWGKEPARGSFASSSTGLKKYLGLAYQDEVASPGEHSNHHRCANAHRCLLLRGPVRRGTL